MRSQKTISLSFKAKKRYLDILNNIDLDWSFSIRDEHWTSGVEMRDVIPNVTNPNLINNFFCSK